MKLNDTRHKVFISYYHHDDQKYKDALEKAFGHLMISKSVGQGDINTDVSTDYVKRLIREDYISDSSVVLVLVGENTRKRKHVDWEVYAGLTKKAGGHSGLLGVYLPELPTDSDGGWFYKDMPQRYADNRKSKYASYGSWASVTASEAAFKNYVEEAFQNRIKLSDKIDNSRQQMQRNLA